MVGLEVSYHLAVLLKMSDPEREVHVVERNGKDETFGFGVVFFGCDPRQYCRS